MRFRMISLLCLCMMVSFAYADQPTKTLAQGGWFAIGGPGHVADVLCAGAPCTDENFASAFGPLISNIPVGSTDLHETRGQAINALLNGDFSIDGQVCQPFDMGQPGAHVSGFVRYYRLSDFTYDQLSQAAASLPSSDGRIFELTQAISTWLNHLNLSNLAVNSGGPLINPVDGQPVDQFNHQVAFIDLDLKGHDLITRWANSNDAVVYGFKVVDLQTRDMTCP